MTQKATSARAATGIEGLDTILGGGLPRNRLYMIEGGGGTGKTTLGLQFCLAGVSSGEKALYISLSETEEELHQIIESHGWSSEGLEILSFSDHEEEPADAEYTLFHPSEVELGQTTQRVLEAVEKHSPQRVVLDTLSGLRLMADDSLRYRRQIESLRGFLTSRGCTVLINDETIQDKAQSAQPRSLAHGVITLEAKSADYGPERRRILIRKIRGIPYSSGYHDISLITGGIRVYPRLVAASHEHLSRQPDPVSSGIREIDQLVGDGLQRGSSTILMGAAGTGKSSLAFHYCMAAAQRGEKSIHYIFDESLETFYIRCRGIGLDPQPYVDNGLLMVEQVDPAAMPPGEFAHNIRELAIGSGVKLVVIDSLSGYLYSMPHERYLHLHLHELLSFLGSQNITVLLTLNQHGLLGDSIETPAELSFLADNLIQLRYFEAQGQVRKALSVFKKRTGSHESTIREIKMMSGEGIKVGAPLSNFHGVLTGVPQFMGDTGSHSPLFDKA